MRYHYEKPASYRASYGKLYRCNHELYSRGTLYEKDGKGFVIIQLHFNPITKHMWWGEIDPYLIDDIYEQDRFPDYFERSASEPDDNGNYPTVTLRQAMWALRMKPLVKEHWECYN